MIETLGSRVDSEQHRVDLVFATEGDGPVNVVSRADTKCGAMSMCKNLAESFEDLVGRRSWNTRYGLGVELPMPRKSPGVQEGLAEVRVGTHQGVRVTVAAGRSQGKGGQGRFADDRLPRRQAGSRNQGGGATGDPTVGNHVHTCETLLANSRQTTGIQLEC